MKTVLVLDHSNAVLELVKKALEGAGYKVITRNKPSGSLASILQDKPDVVLLDVNMPTLSGGTIARILARVSYNPEMLVLLHSNLSIDNLRLKAIATGVHGYIQKTDSPTELVRRVEYWLHRSRYPTSSSRFQVAPEVSADATGAAPGAVSAPVAAISAPMAVSAPPALSGPSAVSAPIAGPSAPTTPSAPSAPQKGVSSSSRWHAAAAATAPAYGAPRSSSQPTAARRPSSASALKSAPKLSDASPPAGTPTSRNMRAAKATAFGSDRPAKVLFVDDDWKILSSYRTMVAGYLDADFVSSSDDAFSRILSDTPPQVVVCDVVMPGLSGADIYRRAVLLDPRWANRFIFVTGAASTAAVAEFINTLDVRVFHKPVPTDRLLDILKHMTEAQRR